MAKSNQTSPKKFLKAKDFDLVRDRVPIENYTSQKVFEEERDKVFRHSWLYVGRESEVLDKGSYGLPRLC